MAMTAIIITLPYRKCKNAGFEADQNWSGCTYTLCRSGACCACAQAVQNTCIARTSFLSRCPCNKIHRYNFLCNFKKKGGCLNYLTWCFENSLFRQPVAGVYTQKNEIKRTMQVFQEKRWLRQHNQPRQGSTNYAEYTLTAHLASKSHTHPITLSNLYF